ncbi:MAG TPA: glycosyltransferase family 39 protein [Solirubrobacteraceae bacterium]|nr:glycosyltransferase family 39 protein [Solirubrobacteraceae bacterium]
MRMVPRGAWARDLWPLAALLALAALARFATLGLQSFWYDEAFTPVHVLHPGLGATLHAVSHTENSPPLWYVLVWGWSRALGTGAIALRSLSALAGVGTVAAGWALGRELGSRRTAIALAAILALNPLMVWYSQEARVYELFALLAAVSLLCFLRAVRAPSTRTLAAWSVSSVLALLTHYFAVFLLAPEAVALLVLLAPGRLATPAPERAVPTRAAVLVAVGALAISGLALLPLIHAQGGHGTQWIGRWALSDRVVQIPGYYLLGAQGSVLGHGLLVLCALPLLGAAGLAGALLAGKRLQAQESRALTWMTALGAIAIAVPFVLALAGFDYLAPRNLIAAWVPLSAALAVAVTARRAGAAGVLLGGAVCVAGAALVLSTSFTPRLQRGDWRGVADVLRAPAHGALATHGASRGAQAAGTEALGASSTDERARAFVTVELGSAPLEYYLPRLRLRPLTRARSVRVSEVDVIGYRPLRRGATRPPTPAFAASGHSDVHGLLIYRFTSATPQLLSERQLRRRTITAQRSVVLVPPRSG